MARIRISPQMFIWPSFSFFVLSRARFKNFFLFIKSVISPLGSFSLLVWPSHCSQFGLLALPHITGGEGTPLMGGNCSPSFAWSIREPISSANSILIFLTSSYFFFRLNYSCCSGQVETRSLRRAGTASIASDEMRTAIHKRHEKRI